MSPEEFLYHEARLLDSQRYEEWLALFTADATYWVPLEQGQKDPHETSSIIHDDRTLLELRVKQIRHPRAHARLPLARTVHQVSNGMVLGEPNGQLHAPNAWHAIDALGVGELVKREAVFIERLLMMDGVSGERVIDIPLDARFAKRFGNPYAVTHRADIHGSLLDGCRASPLIDLRANTR